MVDFELCFEGVVWIDGFLCLFYDEWDFGLDVEVFVEIYIFESFFGFGSIVFFVFVCVEGEDFVVGLFGDELEF